MINLPYLTVREGAAQVSLTVDQFLRAFEAASLPIFRLAYPISYANGVGHAEIEAHGSAQTIASFYAANMGTFQTEPPSQVDFGDEGTAISLPTRLHVANQSERLFARERPDEFAVMPADVATLVKGNDSITSTLDERERTTLLLIIAALSDAAKLDISTPFKAGEFIARTLSAKGVSLSARTVGEHLKDVPDALQKRKV